MSVRFTMLASGSAGNAGLIQIENFGLLLDAGLGPRQLAARLAAVGASWSQIHAVLLTHIHSDHWKDATLNHLHRKRVPLYCHAEHLEHLRTNGNALEKLQADQLVILYEAGQDICFTAGLRCRPLALRHDGGATFGFRIEAASDLFGNSCAMGYVADLGSWTEELAQDLTNVQLLALEFNHDVELERGSGRLPYLIERVLSDDGHLSNVQAVALLLEVLKRSTTGRLRHVIQLHLSRECNHPTLAAQAARAILDEHAPEVELHTAAQYEAGATLLIGGAGNGKRLDPGIPRPKRHAQMTRERLFTQPCLPGMED